MPTAWHSPNWVPTPTTPWRSRDRWRHHASRMGVGLAGVLVDGDVVGARADYDGLRIADCQRLQVQLLGRAHHSAAA